MKINKLPVLLVLFVLLAIGCQSSETLSSPTPVVEITRQVVSEISPNPTPAKCTQPEGVTLAVEPTSSASATFTLTGLQPGERPTFLVIAKPTLSAGMERESLAIEVARDNGELIHEEQGLDALPDSTENSWTVKVIHAQGVTCLEFTLP